MTHTPGRAPALPPTRREPAGRLDIDHNGRVNAADAHAGRIFGAEAGELVGRPVEQLLAIAAALTGLRSGGETRRTGVRIAGTRITGVPFTAEVTIQLTGTGAQALTAVSLCELDGDALAAEARQHFDAAFEHAPIGMALFNPDGEYTRVNAALCAVLGRAPAQLLGRRDQEFTHPDDRAADVAAAWRILRGELSTHQCEKRFLRPDGSTVWVLANLTFLRDEVGRPLSWVGQFQDITRRGEAEQRLRASEERHRLVVRNLPGAGVILYDRDLRCALIEGRHMDEAGLRSDELIGRPLAAATAPEIVEQLEPLARAALRGEPGRMEVFSPISGRWISAEVSPHRDRDDAIAGVLVTVRDVTAQRAAEDARQAAEHQFQVAFERAPIGMAIVDLDGRLRRVNAALSAITGHTREQLLGGPAFMIVHPEDRAWLQATFRALATAVGDEYRSVEHRCQRPDGEPVWVQAEAALIRDPDGQPLHVLIQFQDITDRRRREAELRHLADHDPLTGLLNRRAFRQALDRHLARGRRYGLHGAVLLLDLDGLKQINDRHGHHAGDALIVACADGVRERLRDTDGLGRLGGDEFAALLPRGGAREAEVVAEALVGVVRERAGADAGRERVGVTVSIGVAVLADHAGADADGILELADGAMYAAKAAGRDCYRLTPGRPD